MNQTQIKIVQRTWAKVIPELDQAAQDFLEKILDIKPELIKLFRTDTRELGMLMMAMINRAINALDDFDEFLPEIQKLGSRHAHYGVADEDYDNVAAALLWTLQKYLGDEYTPEVEQAWIAVYDQISLIMKESSARVQTA
jgi:hemoglobin-like flavoprotein